MPPLGACCFLLVCVVLFLKACVLWTGDQHRLGLQRMEMCLCLLLRELGTAQPLGEAGFSSHWLLLASDLRCCAVCLSGLVLTPETWELLSVWTLASCSGILPSFMAISLICLHLSLPFWNFEPVPGSIPPSFKLLSIRGF